MSGDKSNRIVILDYLKFFACILITNSHCREFYPVSFLAIGGGFGNGLFFIISGYFLARIAKPFGEWYSTRVKRLLPVLLVMTCISECIKFLIEGVSGKSLMGELVLIINQYWFVFAIIIFYILYYYIFKNYSRKRIAIVSLVYVMIYFIAYVVLMNKYTFFVELEGFSLFKVYFYFAIFVLGGIIRKEEDAIMEFLGKLKRANHLLIFVFLVSSCLWVISYFITTVLQKLYSIQFLIHVSVFCWVAALFILCLKYKTEWKITNAKLEDSILAISVCTLEIYIVQVTFAKYLPVVFPIGLLLFWSLAIGGGILYHYFVQKLDKR